MAMAKAKRASNFEITYKHQIKMFDVEETKNLEIFSASEENDLKAKGDKCYNEVKKLLCERYQLPPDQFSTINSMYTYIAINQIYPHEMDIENPVYGDRLMENSITMMKKQHKMFDVEKTENLQIFSESEEKDLKAKGDECYNAVKKLLCERYQLPPEQFSTISSMYTYIVATNRFNLVEVHPESRFVSDIDISET